VYKRQHDGATVGYFAWDPRLEGYETLPTLLGGIALAFGVMALAAAWFIRRSAAVNRLILDARRDAQRANTAKSIFLANMSHELRSPLTAILGFSEAIFNKDLGLSNEEANRKYARNINDAGKHLLSIISNILDISKIESNNLSLEKTEMDLAKTIDFCAAMFRRAVEQSGVRLEIDADAAMPDLYADEQLVRQVVINVLSNAVKFTPAGGAIAIAARFEAAGHVVRIADDGIGIAQDDLPKVFAPFQQADSALGRKYEGAGLGLPLTKALVEAHGGTLQLESALGVGTTVVIRFPVHDARAVETAAAA